MVRGTQECMLGLLREAANKENREHPIIVRWVNLESLDSIEQSINDCIDADKKKCPSEHGMWLL
jgi:hypothetical protein